tara:strand:+ start:116557 stop:117372 length:816 start_codon:yes stop_codon:yes gene_type:complete
MNNTRPESKKQEAKNSGTRPFSPIYHNFQNLLENNQGVFRLFRKAKNPGMYQAVWQSRQAEVDTYKERLIQSENTLIEREESYQSLIQNLEINHHENQRDWESKEATWFEQSNEQRQSIEFLQAKLAEAEHQIQKQTQESQRTKENYLREKAALRKDLLAQKEETEKYRILARSLERVIKMNGHKDSKYEDEIKKLETHLNLSQHALIKLDTEYDQSQIELAQLRSRVQELEERLGESERYNKEYKRINHRMENELYRVTTELENIQSFLN